MEFEPTPTGWTPEHSVGVVLVGMAMIDGEVDDTELAALATVLAGFPGTDGVSTQALFDEARAFLSALQQDRPELWLGTLRHHGECLGEYYPAATLESVLERLEDMADADGHTHPMERRLLTAFRARWGLSSS